MTAYYSNCGLAKAQLIFSRHLAPSSERICCIYAVVLPCLILSIKPTFHVSECCFVTEAESQIGNFPVSVLLLICLHVHSFFLSVNYYIMCKPIFFCWCNNLISLETSIYLLCVLFNCCDSF